MLTAASTTSAPSTTTRHAAATPTQAPRQSVSNAFSATRRTTVPPGNDALHTPGQESPGGSLTTAAGLRPTTVALTSIVPSTGGMATGRKVAVARTGPVGATAHCSDPVQRPDQSSSRYPGSGSAVSTILAPSAKTPRHVAAATPQTMPGGTLVSAAAGDGQVHGDASATEARHRASRAVHRDEAVGRRPDAGSAPAREGSVPGHGCQGHERATRELRDAATVTPDRSVRALYRAESGSVDDERHPRVASSPTRSPSPRSMPLRPREAPPAGEAFARAGLTLEPFLAFSVPPPASTGQRALPGAEGAGALTLAAGGDFIGGAVRR
jgi:hypothetical protein